MAPVFGAPGSVTFPGEVLPLVKPSAKPSLSRVLTRAQKLARALKACHRDHVKGKRVACEKQARRKYGAKRKAGSRAKVLVKRGSSGGGGGSGVGVGVGRVGG